MRKPYLKKYGQVANFTVWLVDGQYIRENIDEEFTNFGQHYRFKFIPQNEFWLDKEYHEGEERYYIDHMLVENRLMAQDKSREESIDQADRVERRERSKSKLVIKAAKDSQHKEEIINKIHKQLLKEYSGQVKIWLVNGELVRDVLYVDFTEGGHDKIYSFIPADEIWIDDDLSPQERKFILLHELHERNLMPPGRCCEIKNKILVVDDNYNKIYTAAHLAASELEYHCRRHPEQLEKKIKEEMEKYG